MYGLVGQHVRVHLYTSDGVMLGAIEGRVADVAAQVEVQPGMRKDLALVVDITVPDSDEKYTNSSGIEDQGWFAIQDIEPLDRAADALRSFQCN